MTADKRGTPAEIRVRMLVDLDQIRDHELLALVLITGSRRGRRGDLPRKSWSCVELAQTLMADAGGTLIDLVRKTRDEKLDLSMYSIGRSIGAHLIACVELADRWHRGFDGPGDGHLRTEDRSELLERVFRRQGRVSEGRLLSIILGVTHPGSESARCLLDAFGSPHELMTSLTLDGFETLRKNERPHMRLAGTRCDLDLGVGCRLVAGVELARRYKAQAGRKPLRIDVGALGLSSPELLRLLDPGSTGDREERESLIEVLRSHPALANDFARLDALARDARTASYAEAIELHQMFEQLRKRQTWATPVDVLGDRVPYRGLLAITAARIERSKNTPRRLLQLQDRLQRAEEEAIGPPLEAFVDSLVALEISESGARRALEATRQRHEAGVGGTEAAAPGRAP
ncbi:MAG: hypothetical protein GY719_37805 [bacterium]|nr:hypothetical protein [bacterium]